MDAETTKAYLAGLKLKHTGLSEEVIYARLEKQGFSEDLARQVAKDVIRENEKEQLNENLNYGLIIAIIGILATVASFFIFENRIYIFPGLLLAGVGSILLIVAKRKDK
jgi:hypothetical protein